jgi:replicative DNA helicase
MRIQELIPKVLDHIEEIHEALSSSAIRTGYKELDRIIKVLYPGELAVICSSGELGEQFVQNIILNQLKIKPDSSILIIPKTTKERYVMSLLSIQSEVFFSSISEANPPLDGTDRNKIALATETLLQSNIQISDNRTIATGNGFSELEELYSASTLDLMVIDDLDSITFKEEVKPFPTYQSDKNVKTTKLTKAEIIALKLSILNDIARRFHIPMLIVYSGSVDKLELNTHVNVIDSYFSSADVVLEMDDERLGQTGLVDIHIRKNKYGQLGDASLYYCDEFTCFDSHDIESEKL